jgi:Ohr subfamily peroxiredoxin
MSEHAPVAPEKILYTAKATATGGRDGRARTEDGTLDLALSVPKGLGGPGAAGTNPEQLFAAGYAACFGSAVGHVARLKKVKVGTVQIDAEVSIGPAGAGFGLAVKLVAHLPDVDRATAEDLVRTAHQVCPYSNATRGNIPVDVSLA